MSDEGVCSRCSHPEHPMGVRCDYALTETYRDDVGIFTRPSGIVRTDIVGTCKCTAEPPVAPPTDTPT